MPFRDHYRPPVDRRVSWEGFHSGWTAVLVQHLVKVLPEQFQAEPRVRLGSVVAADDAPESSGSVKQYEYAVLVYDQDRGRHLVAAVEIVSPANKDRGLNRQAFITKCAALLQQGVCVSIVDLVTIRRANLYTELLKFLETADPSFGPKPPATYAVTCRRRNIGERSRLESWAYPLGVGQPLPPLPIWLAEDLHVTLDLEGSYEDACRVFRIP
jgi:hypothetical protein